MDILCKTLKFRLRIYPSKPINMRDSELPPTLIFKFVAPGIDLHFLYRIFKNVIYKQISITVFSEITKCKLFTRHRIYLYNIVQYMGTSKNIYAVPMQIEMRTFFMNNYSHYFKYIHFVYTKTLLLYIYNI